MRRCRKCRVPLEGTMAKIVGKILRVFASKEDPTLCHRCYSKQQKESYVCRICNRVVDTQSALTHVKAEEYLLSLIKKDHPEWKDEHGACPQCIDYYRQLIDKAKI